MSRERKMQRETGAFENNFRRQDNSVIKTKNIAKIWRTMSLVRNHAARQGKSRKKNV